MPMLEEQEGKSKPLFMVYHDCKMAERFEGCKTPHLRNILYHLCRCGRKPEFYLLRRNPRFLEQWLSELGESPEVSLHQFLQALRVWSLVPPSAPDFELEEIQSMSSALMTSPSHDRYGATLLPGGRRGSDSAAAELLRRRVHVRHCADWLAGVNVADAFQAAVPEFHERLAEIQRQEERDRIAAMQEAFMADKANATPINPTSPMMKSESGSNDSVVKDKRLVDSMLNPDEERAMLAALQGSKRQSLRTVGAGLPLPDMEGDPTQ
eukprot:Hpha_TRINITY_DN12518_c0_g1::TRINITY_DN12518_c0_g1_i1::g.51046::m.51046